jgi:transposase InsO family protein
VVNFVRSCPFCQKSRVTVRDAPAPEVRVIEVYEPFGEVLVDFMTKLPKDDAGNVNILVVVDNFTKFVELFPVPDLLAETTAACLLQVFSRYGPIRRIRSDRGSQFTGSLCSKLCELAGCQQVLTVGYRPRRMVLLRG